MRAPTAPAIVRGSRDGIGRQVEGAGDIPLEDGDDGPGHVIAVDDLEDQPGRVRDQRQSPVRHATAREAITTVAAADRVSGTASGFGRIPWG